jgi:hypothetical protein
VRLLDATDMKAVPAARATSGRRSGSRSWWSTGCWRRRCVAAGDPPVADVDAVSGAADVGPDRRDRSVELMLEDASIKLSVVSSLKTVSARAMLRSFEEVRLARSIDAATAQLSGQVAGASKFD